MPTATTDYQQLTGTYEIDPSHSRIGFVARHAMVAKVRGTFKTFEGKAVIDGANPGDSRVAVTIKVDSIDTNSADRDAHLRSNDFFDMEQHPEITFVSTAVRQVSEDKFELTGDLTVRGVTQSVTVPLEFGGAATDPFGNHRVGFEGKVTVNRKDFGLTWNAALEAGGVLVGDKVVLEIEVSAIRADA